MAATKPRGHLVMNLKISGLALLLCLTACATTRTADEAQPPVDLTGAVMTSHTEANGDVIEEYRVGTLLRMVKITPAHGPAYYLYDRNGDGHLDRNSANKNMPAAYWKLFSW
jgi:hypothetical protein